MDNNTITYYTLDQAREILREEARQKRIARQKREAKRKGGKNYDTENETGTQCLL